VQIDQLLIKGIREISQNSAWPLKKIKKIKKRKKLQAASSKLDSESRIM